MLQEVCLSIGVQLIRHDEQILESVVKSMCIEDAAAAAISLTTAEFGLRSDSQHLGCNVNFVSSLHPHINLEARGEAQSFFVVRTCVVR